MGADKKGFGRIEGTVQADGSVSLKQDSPGSGNAMTWKFSCDGIWAVGTLSSDRRSRSSPTDGFRFSVGTGHLRDLRGKPRVSVVALATAAALVLGPSLPPDARAQAIHATSYMETGVANGTVHTFE